MKSLWERYRKRGSTCGQSERPLRRLCLRDMEPSAPAAGLGAHMPISSLLKWALSTSRWPVPRNSCPKKAPHGKDCSDVRVDAASVSTLAPSVLSVAHSPVLVWKPQTQR